MRLRPKYTRAKEEGKQGSGSLISTFLMCCCRPRELVSAASGDELCRVLKMLLESIHGFLHQPLVLDAEHPKVIPMDLPSPHQASRGPMTRARARAL